MNLYRRVISIDPFLFLALGLFLLLTMPSIGNIPHRDGNINFVQSYDMFQGGFSLLLQHWSTIHPPLLVLLAAGTFKLIGVSAYSFNILARLVGLLGIWFIYQLGVHLVGKTVARWSAILLSAYPLYLANSVFPVTDCLLAVCMVAAILAYARQRLIWMSVLLTLGILIKETGVILPIAILAVESISLLTKIVLHQKHCDYKQSITFAGIPILIFLYWVQFLTMNGVTPWSDHILTSTGQYGSFYTVLYNLVTFSFINPYAIQNWLHLFVLNFAWVYWVVFFIGVCVYVARQSKRFLFDLIRNKTIVVSTVFCLSYIVTVLSFQTYTIPRYVLPVFPFVILGFSWAASVIIGRNRIVYVTSMSCAAAIIVLSLFRSADPVSLALWGTTYEFGEKLYDLRGHSSGNDGVTYNMQYVSITDKRTALIRNIEAGNMNLRSEEDCRKVFPDPNDDKISLRALGYSRTMSEGLDSCAFTW